MSKWDDVDLEEVEAMAGRGLTQYQIADCLGISTSTLQQWKLDHSEFSESLKRGRSKGINTIASDLFENARAGNTTAQIYYLKCRDPKNWNDRVMEQNNTTININTKKPVEEMTEAEIDEELNEEH